MQTEGSYEKCLLCACARVKGKPSVHFVFDLRSAFLETEMPDLAKSSALDAQITPTGSTRTEIII